MNSIQKSIPQMKPKILKNEGEYKAALGRVEQLIDATPGSPDEDELELWSLLVAEYERKHHPMDHPDPIEPPNQDKKAMGLFDAVHLNTPPNALAPDEEPDD